MIKIVSGVLESVWSPIERRLDQVAMYRTVTISLSFIAIVSIILGLFAVVPYSGVEQGISLLVALTSALLVNWLCSKVWRLKVNMESALIAALILHFLIIPARLTDLADSWVIAAVVTLAIISKFVFAWQRQHIVNPAAFGLVLMALAYTVFNLPGYFESTWWIGRPELFLPLVIAGVAVVAKVRKWVPALTFLTVAFAVFLFEEYRFAGMVGVTAIGNFWLSGPSLFLAFFMLTEPFTMPPTKKFQVLYGAFVGFISQTTLFITFGLKMTPELALVLGNLCLYPTTLRRKLIMPLTAVTEVAKDTFEFAFKKPAGLRFRAGQYLEWMLPHSPADNRGIRRYFTIASAPMDEFLKLTVRFGERVSSYKQTLKLMKPGDSIIASQLAGDFVLPQTTDTKLALVAGGIGITPFMSQIAAMQTGAEKKHDSVLFYCNNGVADIAYRDMLAATAKTLPLKVVHILAKEQVASYEYGFLTEEIIRRHSPDFLTRTWFISGPPGMVNVYTKLLQDMGVSPRNIKKDFFPGLA
jgi:glycine betaine catabolism B